MFATLLKTIFLYRISSALVPKQKVKMNSLKDVCGVTVIIIRSGLSYTSSNPEQGYLHFM